MKLATWNVNGIRSRAAQVLEWAERERPDVICLQELKATAEQVPASLRELDRYWSYWHGGKAYSGVALLIAKELSPEPPIFSHPPFDMEFRIVTATVGKTTIASVYVPNGGKNFGAKMTFLAAMEEYAQKAVRQKLPLIIAGDLNIAHREIDVHPKERKNVIGQLPIERTEFDKLLAAGLVDVGRLLDLENDQLFTWWAPWRRMRQRNIGWRLDYILSTRTLSQAAKSCVVQADIGTSDHAPVIAVFKN